MNDTSPDGLVGGLLGPVPKSPAVVERLRLAGKPVVIRFGSQPLAELLVRSLRHLRHPSSEAPELVIDCWNLEDTPAPARPAGWADDGLNYLETGPIQLAWEAQGGRLVVYDRDRNHAWMRFGPLDSIPAWEAAAPFRTILHWWASDHSMQLIHAAAVGDSRGGVLLVGRGGSGKSTTALACLVGGLGYAGDDYCLVEPGPSPRVHGLYLSGKGHPQTADLLPQLRGALLSGRRTDEGKSIVFADEIAPSSISLGFPLVSLVVPHIDGRDFSELQPLSPVEALRAVAPSTVLQLPGQRSPGLARLADLVRRVPCWKLGLSRDPGNAVQVLADLIARQRKA